MQNLPFRQTIKDEQWSTDQLNIILDALDKVSKTPLPSKVWLAGGCLRRAAIGHDILTDADVDLFFQDEAGFRAVYERLQTLTAKHIYTNDYTSTFILSYNILDDYNSDGPGASETVEIKFQLIKLKFYNTLEEVLDNFDYTICQLGVELGTDTLVVGDTTLEDLENMKLVVNKVNVPISCIQRLVKFSKQGFKADYRCAHTILKAVVDNPALLQELPKYEGEEELCKT